MRCRSTGSTIPTAGSTSFPQRWLTFAASPAWAAHSRPANFRSPTFAPNSDARRIPRRCPGFRSRSRGRPSASPRSASPARSPTSCSICSSARSLGAQGANLTALLLTAIANTAANRRLTFGLRGPGKRARSQLEGLVVFGIGLGLTSGALAIVHALSAHPRRTVEVSVLVLANLHRDPGALRPAPRLGVPPPSHRHQPRA